MLDFNLGVTRYASTTWLTILLRSLTRELATTYTYDGLNNLGATGEPRHRNNEQHV
jgi:hypothetical protein